MILHKVIFGPVPTGRRSEAEDAVESYISVLLHNGQACGEYFHVMQGGKLCAYVQLAGIRALAPVYRSTYEADRLKKVRAVFGRSPRWLLADDEAPKSDITWTNAPFLYLFTHMFDWESPLCRGDSGRPVPLYRLPDFSHEDREAIYFWQRAYREHDAIWIGSGDLEIPVYRQLASPDSGLSRQGRDICKRVESVTGIATYYFLMRYWGRRGTEDKRLCPSCGRAWRTAQPVNHPGGFWRFTFQCKRCRLVSHVADSYDNARHARIGEWSKAKTRSKASALHRGPRRILTGP